MSLYSLCLMLSVFTYAINISISFSQSEIHRSQRNNPLGDKNYLSKYSSHFFTLFVKIWTNSSTQSPPSTVGNFIPFNVSKFQISILNIKSNLSLQLYNKKHTYVCIYSNMKLQNHLTWLNSNFKKTRFFILEPHLSNFVEYLKSVKVNG